MTHAYRWVQWNRHKRVYDAVIIAALLAYLVGFVGIASAINAGPRAVSPPILAMRALGTAAAVMLHMILAIGPLSRLTPLMAPVLYNRRHLGVACFAVALLHAVIAIGFYGGFGVVNPIAAVLNGPGLRPPFELYGLGVLLVLFAMAATSHDFWLATLGPGLWKGVHMLVYPAYVLLVAHIAFGGLRTDRGWTGVVLLGAGVVGLTTLHVVTGLRERGRDARATAAPSGWIDLGTAAELTLISDQRARVVCTPDAERIAVFRDGDRLHAVSNVCPHQGGPLGEGRIVNGCVTCPWHGHQFALGTGQAPAPYTDRVPTHELRLDAGRVRLDRSASEGPTPGVSLREERDHG